MSSNHDLFAGAKAVLALINDTADISEIEVVLGDTRIFVRRFEAVDQGAGALAPPPAQPTVAAVEPERPETIVEIQTPLTGIYYGSPSPGAKSFVEEGDLVAPEQTVCLIEAMKVFNAISSKVAGRVVRLLVKNGELVKAGQVLIEIDTAGASDGPAQGD